MAGKRSAKTNPSQARKRIEAVDTKSASTLVRSKDGSAFARCGECKKDVPMALISMHSCSLEAKIKMNLEAQVIEKPTEVKKPEERKKPTSKEPKAKRAKVEKDKKKDPNAPKRPVTAFFVFLEEFRKEYKEANPDAKGVKRVAKEAGEKWKSMTDEEKKPYQDKAAELKAEYEKAMEAYKAEDEAQDVDQGSDNDKESEEKDAEEDEKSDKGAVANELEEVTDEE